MQSKYLESKWTEMCLKRYSRGHVPSTVPIQVTRVCSICDLILCHLDLGVRVLLGSVVSFGFIVLFLVSHQCYL